MTQRRWEAEGSHKNQTLLDGIAKAVDAAEAA
jgi:hypothetical protein